MATGKSKTISAKRTSEDLQPKAMRVQLHAKQEDEAQYDVHEEALEELSRRGVKLPSRPRFEGSLFADQDGWYVIPPNLNELTNEEIGELYNIVQACSTYISGQLARVRNEVEVSKKKLGFTNAQLLLSKQGANVKEREKTTLIDQRYVSADAQMLKLKCLLTLLEEARKASEGDIKMISRIVTIREQDLAAGQRSASIGSRRMSPLGGSGKSPLTRRVDLPRRDSELVERKVSMPRPSVRRRR